MAMSDIMSAIAPQAKAAVLWGVSQYLDSAFKHFDLTPKQQVYFFGQAAEETDGFHTLVEYSSGKGYEGRIDLGNTEAGDGPRFKGRGIFQLTGRSNYRLYGTKLGVDFITHPEFAALPQYAVLTACQYWSDRHIAPYAEADDIIHVTKLINGGTNGIKDRIMYTQRAAKAMKVSVPSLPVTAKAA